MKISITASGVDEVRSMLRRIGTESTTQALAQTVVQVEDYIRNEAGKHQKTGALNSSIFKQRQSDGSWLVGHDERRAPHALFVVWGTKPHLIARKKKQMLRWPAGGAFRFAKVVHHPGNKPDNWLSRAATLAPKIFEQHVRQRIAQLN